MLVLGAILIAGALAQDPPAAKVPDRALIKDLIEKTNGLESFYARYRLTSETGKDDSQVQLAYRAPGECWMQTPGPAFAHVRLGVSEIVTQLSGKAAQRGRVDYASASEGQCRMMAEKSREQFPDCAAEGECLPYDTVEFDLSTSPDLDRDRDIVFRASVGKHGSTMLGWLDILLKSKDVRFDGEERILAENSRGTRIWVSTRTGFLERMECTLASGKKVLELEKLELDPDEVEERIHLPASKEGEEDISGELFGGSYLNITIGARHRLYKWISSRVTGGQIKWDGDAPERVRRIFEALYADALPVTCAPWLSERSKWLDELDSNVDGWIRSGIAQGKGLKHLEDKLQEVRTALVGALDSQLRGQKISLTFPEPIHSDAELSNDLARIDSEAFEAAFAAKVGDPLIAKLDQAVARTKGDH